MSELPPILGRFTRTRVVILVTGRTALARVGGITSVARHVATARRLGFDPIVVYPARMRALGAEIAGELEDDTPVIPSDEFTDQAGLDDDWVLVIAGDWYVAPHAIVEFNDRTKGAAVARLEDRGRVAAPVARLRVRDLRRIIPEIENKPTGELILAAADEGAHRFDLAVAERHRLSDNIAVAHCENKLFAAMGELSDEPLHVVALQRYLAIPIARRLARTPVAPTHLAVAKIVAGLLAARLLAVPAYAWGLTGALLAFASRVLDAASDDLARAAVRASPRNDRFDLAGDLLVQLAVVWGVASRFAGSEAYALATVTTAGIVVSAFVAYTRVFKRVWDAQARRERHTVARDNYGSRFARRNGPAYALLLCALAGRLDLFLWATAIVSHLFYIGWLLEERRA